MSLLAIAITALLFVVLAKPIILVTFWVFVYAYSIPVVIYIKTKELIVSAFRIICRL